MKHSFILVCAVMFAAQFATSGCLRRSGSGSELNIVGGSVVDDKNDPYPSVKLLMSDPVDHGYCTGVVVSDSTLLMAAIA